jgi:type IV secretory pathway TraG/TraD family ATPase VirD4
MRTASPCYPDACRMLAVFLFWVAPISISQAQSSPFMTGATALQTNLLAWLTPIAIILVMALGAMAMANRMTRDGEGEPVWFVVDELDALGQIDGLKDALARLRKFGGRCVLGFQSIAQVSSTYGGGEAQTIVENCGNTLILRCSGSEHGGTSQFASRLIGEREVVRRQVARAHDRGGWFGGGTARRSTTFSRQQTIETAVLAAEIEQLPDLSGFLKTAASPAWLRVTVRRRG